MDGASLHRLLENTYNAHKQDIFEVAGGHLNHNKLPKLTAIDSTPIGSKWLTSQPSKDNKENPYERRSISKRNADNMLANGIGLMQNALVDFSVGTMGALPQGVIKTGKTKRGKRRKQKRNLPSRESSNSFQFQPTKSEIELENVVMNEIEKMALNYRIKHKSSLITDDKTTEPSEPGKQNMPTDSSQKALKAKVILPYSITYNQAMTEELKLPELMMPEVSDKSRLPPSIQQKFHNPNKTVTRKFLTTHHAAISKTDQFRKLLDFETNILHKYETMERNVRDGHKAVDHLEQKLIHRLLNLQNNEASVVNPNFERLQAYSEVWSDLCIDSTCLGRMLFDIKQEYDVYLSYLLDEVKKSKHMELLRCMGQIQPTEDKELEVNNLLHEVEGLELDAKTALLRNATLQQKLKNEAERIREEKYKRQLEEEDKIRRMLPTRKPIRKQSKQQLPTSQKQRTEKFTTEEKLRDLRKKLWVELDEHKVLQTDLKNSFVPKAVHKNYVHAGKDTELEIHKMLQTKKQLSSYLSRLETQLNSELNNSKMSSAEKEKFVVFLNGNV